MQVRKVEVIPFAVPIRSFADAYTDFATSNAVLVKIYSEDDHIGYGEACAWEPEFYGETLESGSSTIENYIAPKIFGQDLFNINRIMSMIDANLAKVTCAKEGIDVQ